MNFSYEPEPSLRCLISERDPELTWPEIRALTAKVVPWVRKTYEADPLALRLWEREKNKHLLQSRRTGGKFL